MLLVIGDAAACREATALLGDGLDDRPRQARPRDDRRADDSAPPCARARRGGARDALRDTSRVRPYDPGHPCEIRVVHKNTVDPAKLASRAGVEQVDGLDDRLPRRRLRTAKVLFF